MPKVSSGPSVRYCYKKNGVIIATNCMDGLGDTLAIKIIVDFLQPLLFTEDVKIF